MNKIYWSCLSLALLTLTGHVTAKEESGQLKSDTVKVKAWNEFADGLVTLHENQLKTHETRTETEVGGYGGLHADKDFYTETRYYDSKTGKLLSRVQRETDHPDLIHMIEINIYDEQGAIQRDYLAAWLPHYRNAPVQTLINLHNKTDELHAFRQFDASGERIYEQCMGKYFGKHVDIQLYDADLSPFRREPHKAIGTEEYTACFGDVPAELGEYIDPLKNLPKHVRNTPAELDDPRRVIESRIDTLTTRIAANKGDARLYLQRGDLHMKLLNFYDATKDYSAAIERDAGLDEAWFGRGLARGRSGEIEEGIADLGVYIKRHPDSSVAYTKRGVRRIWHGDLVNAEKDLRKAVALDSTNAEAHDDLAVLIAQQGQYDDAIAHLQLTIKHDPTYQKGFHNLATVQFITQDYPNALKHINQALILDPNAKESLLLRGEILMRLGNKPAALQSFEQAEFLPDSTGHESMSIRH